MRRAASLSLFLALLSLVSGYLLSNASLVGRVGISLFYQEYGFLKIWWQAALVVFAALILLYALQSLIQRMAGRSVSRAVHIFALVAALVGLYLSYDYFRNNLAHRWMGERFHLGIYLFWLGWMVISVYLLTIRRTEKALKNKVGMDV